LHQLSPALEKRCFRTQPALSGAAVQRWFFPFVVVAAPGCMNLPAATSGEVGCPESEIEISDDNQSRRARSEKYGAPHVNHKGGTAYCRSQGMVRCTAAGGAKLTQAWEWRGAQKIFLLLKGKDGRATLAVRYLTQKRASLALRASRLLWS
jgi:hypothetical protein